MQDVSGEVDKLFWLHRIELNSSGRDVLYHQVKRIFDVTIAIFSLLLLLPLLALIAIIIKLTSPGPALFIQERIGARRKIVNGRVSWEACTFPVCKFRTMWVDADSKLHKQYIEAYIAGDEAGMATIQPGKKSPDSYKLKDDPRITPIGKILRQTSLDELPQIWNVLKGEMSLVGPRPPIPYEVKKYSQNHMRRLAALPGITGLWQISGRCETTFEEMVQLDLEYIDNQSTWLDLKIILLTIPVVLSKRGAG